ncbi:MAG: cytochrome P450 [Rhodobacteraceae bacterium]|nr:cytochrome P450 [Paracoccaceae bacterium]
MTLPPKPAARPERVSLLGYLRRFRADILSAQPAKLYRARMAEFRTPFFRSYLVNQPDLIRTVLHDRPAEFPKSDRVGAGLRPLLGNSVFLTNGATWARQRRIIDPAFEGGRLRDTFPAMLAAGNAAVARLSEGIHEIEAETSHAAADVIFRTLFSIPIEDDAASAVFHQFRDYQRSQPLLNLAAFVRGPAWMPRFHRASTRATARAIRGLIAGLTEARRDAIAKGTAPDDLATKIMTTRDPETGATFDAAEMVDQVAIFFLAGHETSASALAWALYLLALYPQVQERVAVEVADFPDTPSFSDMKRLPLTRDVFREALRLYPPVPMMVRETVKPERFRDRDIAKGSQIVLSPWHLHRHERLWDRPDAFDPDRYDTENGKTGLREAFIPFSAGPRVCTGAGFAMVEGPLFLAMLVKAFRFDRVEGCDPVPVAHLTVRARDGIWLNLTRRQGAGATQA